MTEPFEYDLTKVEEEYKKKISGEPLLHHDISKFQAKFLYHPDVFHVRLEHRGTPLWTFKRVRKSDFRDNVAALRNEKRHGRAMWNPFVTKLYGTWRGAEYVYFQMECGGLGDLTNFEKELKPKDIKRWGAQMIRGLDYMHACGLIHRNFGPRHCVRYCNNIVKICSFRATCRNTPEEARGRPAPPYYAAPEMFIEDQPYGIEVDWWQLGMTLRYLVQFNTYPYKITEQDSADEVRRKMEVNDIDVDPQADADLQPFLEGLLKKDPRERLKGRFETGGSDDNMEKHIYFKNFDFNELVFKRDISEVRDDDVLKSERRPRELYDLFVADADETKDPRYEDFDDF